jgi:hypothetical protein
MVNGALNLDPTALDLGLEEHDPLLELLDRIRIEILLRQLRDKVILATRKIFVGVHEAATSASAGAMSIRGDRSRGISVRPSGGSYGERGTGFLRRMIYPKRTSA